LLSVRVTEISRHVPSVEGTVLECLVIIEMTKEQQESDRPPPKRKGFARRYRAPAQNPAQTRGGGSCASAC
jgi:hypothetical protein